MELREILVSCSHLYIRSPLDPFLSYPRVVHLFFQTTFLQEIGPFVKYKKVQWYILETGPLDSEPIEIMRRELLRLRRKFEMFLRMN